MLIEKFHFVRNLCKLYKYLTESHFKKAFTNYSAWLGKQLYWHLLMLLAGRTSLMSDKTRNLSLERCSWCLISAVTLHKDLVLHTIIPKEVLYNVTKLLRWKIWDYLKLAVVPGYQPFVQNIFMGSENVLFCIWKTQINVDCSSALEHVKSAWVK